MSGFRIDKALRLSGAEMAERHRIWFARWQRKQLAARDVKPGESWAFRDHKSLAEVAA